MVEDQPELRDSRGPLDRKSVIFAVIGEPKTKFVHQRRRDRVVVRSHEAAILIVGPVIRKKIAGGGNDAGTVELAVERVLEAVAHVDLLLRIEIVVDADIE